MLKAGIKRRRTTQQIKEQKEEESLRTLAIEDKLAKYEEMMAKFNAVKEEAENGRAASNVLSDMFNRGEVELDQNGTVKIIPQSVEQSEMSQDNMQQEVIGMSQGSNGFQI